MGPTGCPQTPVKNYHYWPRNIQEERRFCPLRGWSLKSRVVSNVYILTSQIMLILMLARKVNRVPSPCVVGFIPLWQMQGYFKLQEASSLERSSLFIVHQLSHKWRCRKHGHHLHRARCTSYSDQIHKGFWIQDPRGIEDKLDVCMEEP
jgi:hypothetical protein